MVDEALARTQPAHQALWDQLGRSERVVLGAVADGVAPSSRALAADHQLARRTLDLAAKRLADQGHLVRERVGARVIDPLLAGVAAAAAYTRCEDGRTSQQAL